MAGLTRRDALATAGVAATWPAGARAQPATVKAGLEQMIAAGGLPGVVTLTWRGEGPTEVNALGLADIESRRPMQRDTLFGLASMTKPITAALALTLVDDGTLRLDDPIARWAPEFAQMRVLRRPDGPLDDTYAAPRSITVEDLLTHRSGVSSYGFLAPGPLGAAIRERFGFGFDSALSPDAWMAAFAALPLAYAPGARFNYGHSYDVLGVVLARAAKRDLRTLFHERVFDPLGMRDTDGWVPPAKRDRLATSYSSPALGQFNRADVGTFTAAQPHAFISGGQGLVSCADDLMEFARMLMAEGAAGRRRILKPETVRLMTTDRITPAQRDPTAPLILGLDWRVQGYGLGVGVITDGPKFSASPAGAGSTGAFGWAGAYGGDWRIDPARKLIWIWLQEVLPGPPGSGAMPRLPGRGGLVQFQKLTFANA